MSSFKRFCRVVAHVVLTATLVQTVNPAFAQSTSGVSQEVMLRGDIRITKNSSGAVIANIPAGQTATDMYAMSGNSPMIWGRYYPATKSGTIQVSFMKRNLHAAGCVPSSPATCGVEIETIELSPDKGTKFQGNGVKTYFDGVNPFEAFRDPAGSPLYRNIALGAFQAAMGMWAKHYSTSRGFLAVADQKYNGLFNWDECSKRVLGACVRRRYHTEANATIKPAWYIMTTADRAQGRGVVPIYRARGCISSDVACGVTGGMAFLKASDQSDFPSTEERLWHQHIWDDSWTMMAFIIVIATIVSAGTLLFAAGPLMFASSLAGMGGISNLGLIALVEGVGFGLSYGLISYALDGGHGGFGDAQDGFFGGLSDGYVENAAPSNPQWSPTACIESGSGPHATDPGRHGGRECRNWISGDLSSAPTGVGTFFNQRNSQPDRDWSVTNDVKALRDSGGMPVRNGGMPERQ